MKAWITIGTLAVAILLGMSPGAARAKTASRPAKAAVAESNEGLQYTPADWPEAPDTAGMLRRLVVGTTIVLGLCLCTLLVGKRWLRGAPAGPSSGNALHLLETVSLGNRCSIHLLQAGDHQVLVGVDGSGVKTLVALPQSFERAIADAGPPGLELAEEFDGDETTMA